MSQENKNMKKSQARGYLLEIVLSKLIEINGYDVITKEDNKEIFRRGNGLNVKGRGGYDMYPLYWTNQ